MNRFTSIIVLVVLFLTAASCMARVEEPYRLSLTASAKNQSPGFYKFLFSYPVSSPALLSKLDGSISIATEGQGFAQALVSVDYIPTGNACPANGEKTGSYSDIRNHFPALKNLAHFIVKEPPGSRDTAIPISFKFPKGMLVSGCMVVILDGSVRITGGPFTMTSRLTAELLPASNWTGKQLAIVPLDDEFCFGVDKGCQRATIESSPGFAFMRVAPITTGGTLLALYDDLSDTTLGSSTSASAKNHPWGIENDYYIYHHCTLKLGIYGPTDYYTSIPADATSLLSVKMQGDGQAALQRPVFQSLHENILPGDCLIHLIRANGSVIPALGGIDAENQVFALILPNAHSSMPRF